MERIEHTVVKEPTVWDRLDNIVHNGVVIGYNRFDEKVYDTRVYHTGTLGAAITGIGGMGAALTIFEDISYTARSITNFRVGISVAKFEGAMEKAAGKVWEMTADGKAKILIYNCLKYVSRLSTKGEATIDIYREGQLLQKYRLQ